MKNIQLLNKIDEKGIAVFNCEKYTLAEETENPCGILVRSASMHEYEFGSNLLAIARAGAGVNNIPIDRCSQKGIVVFNTPGANANGVKELTIAALMLSSRRIVEGINWATNLAGQTEVAKLVEKGKSQFSGPEIKGKTLGVIGLGAIGGMVANVAYSLGMEVIGCDPYITVNSAWSLSRAVAKAENYDEIYASSDYISIHVPSLPTTKNLINKESIAKMKDGVRIINMSRGDLVNNEDIVEAVKSGKVASYVTDFPSEELLGVEGIITIPHLGASTPESEENCAVMASEQMLDYLENGNIHNSVNYPEIVLPRKTKNRIVVLHDNIPKMLAQISTALSSDHINIESLLSHAKGQNAISLFDTNDEIPQSVIDKIMEIPSIIRTIVV